MNIFEFAKAPRLAAALGLLACAGFAQAQYVWIDAKGQRQYSDRPPPASVPQAKILKSPRPSAPGAANTSVPSSPAFGISFAGEDTPLSEREAAFRKRRAEQTESEKKASEEAKIKADKEYNCKTARAAKLDLESGARLATIDDRGERSFMSDEQRAVHLKRTNGILADCR